MKENTVVWKGADELYILNDSCFQSYDKITYFQARGCDKLKKSWNLGLKLEHVCEYIWNIYLRGYMFITLQTSINTCMYDQISMWQIYLIIIYIYIPFVSLYLSYIFIYIYNIFAYPSRYLATPKYPKGFERAMSSNHVCVFIDWKTIPASFRPLPFQPHFCAEVFVFRFQDQHSAEVMIFIPTAPWSLWVYRRMCLWSWPRSQVQQDCFRCVRLCWWKGHILPRKRTNVTWKIEGLKDDPFLFAMGHS